MLGIIEYNLSTEKVICDENGNYKVIKLKKKEIIMPKLISSYEYSEMQKELKEFELTVEKLEKIEEELLSSKKKNLDVDRRISELIERHGVELKSQKDEFQLNEKKAVAAMEDKISQLKNSLEEKHQKDMYDLKERVYEEKSKDLEKMMKKNYDKLSDSMTKLHEEGNAQTKQMLEISKEVIRATGLNGSKPEVKKIDHV